MNSYLLVSTIALGVAAVGFVISILLGPRVFRDQPDEDEQARHARERSSAQ